MRSARSKWEYAAIGLLCLVAAGRVWVCSAALPFFNNVDEEFHWDLVTKYARGYWPVPQKRLLQAGQGELYGREAARITVLMRSPEFSDSPDSYPGGHFPPPPWTRPQDDRDKFMLAGVFSFTHFVNHESFSPPVYYLLAGGWYNLGHALGLRDGRLLYWIRFLNVPLMVMVVLLAYGFCVRFYPEQPMMRLGVPLLLAFVPQDVFCAINCDVASPPLFLAALWLLLEWYTRPRVSPGFCILTGLILAATFLVKYTNAALLVVLAALAVRKLWTAWRLGHFGQQLRAFGLLSAVAAAPIAAWCVRNRLLIGDYLATAPKVKHLGWTPKAWSQLLDHPIFAPAGLGYFLNELTGQLWRGEISWWNMPYLARPEIDPFFVAASGIFIAAGLLRWCCWRKRDAATERLADGVSLLSLLVSVLMLIWLSIRFDFGKCYHPSSQDPYLYMARLIAGILVPFFMLYVRGVQFVFAPISRVIAPALVLAATVALMVASKVGPIVMAGHSPYNWFHMP